LLEGTEHFLPSLRPSFDGNRVGLMFVFVVLMQQHGARSLEIQRKRKFERRAVDKYAVRERRTF